jgi:hypothetical protein
MPSTDIPQRAYLTYYWIVWDFELGRRRDDLNASGYVLYAQATRQVRGVVSYDAIILKACLGCA